MTRRRPDWVHRVSGLYPSPDGLPQSPGKCSVTRFRGVDQPDGSLSAPSYTTGCVADLGPKDPRDRWTTGQRDFFTSRCRPKFLLEGPLPLRHTWVHLSFLFNGPPTATRVGRRVGSPVHLYGKPSEEEGDPRLFFARTNVSLLFQEGFFVCFG